ncbi:Ig-like domain-containing protein [Microbacterium karelineae]|uniref:Ig-like domain-containing protein n=1 Tax=Microbacterium karelineae TaxID=2654283 RepID=UPI0012EA4980|nr:Ig-like domain-containing protein [Microbacterium karelineae]
MTRTMNRLRARWRTLTGGSIVAIAAIGITTLAVAYEGEPTTEVDLNDGSVWITKQDQQFVGHFNARSEVLDGRFAAATADYDVLQDGERAFVHDTGDATIGRIDTATVSAPERAQVPDDAFVDYAARTVAILDAEKGDLFVVPADGVPSFSLAEAEPVLEDLGGGAVATVGRDGAVHVASPEKARLYTVPVSAEGQALDDELRDREVAVSGEADLEITSVGERSVVLDRTEGALLLDGGEPVALEGADGARLAGDAAESDDVVVATAEALVRVPFDGSDPIVTPTGGSAGEPAAPVSLNGCAYGAWAGSGRFVRDCLDDAHDRAEAISEYRAGGELRFRVNRDVVILNDVTSGAAWFASDVMQKVDNWDDLTPPEGDGEENPDPTTVQVPDPSPPDRGEDNTPPIANDDAFGVRAGSSAILPVLDNDSDPDGDVLVVDLPGGAPDGVDVQPIHNSSSLQITVPEGVTGVESFRYRVDDGREGGTDEARVSIAVVPEDENAPPEQRREQFALQVETGGALTYNVLPDWIDPDGDSLFLESVTALEGDEVEFTADGRITYRALSGSQGMIDVPITVSDGRGASMTGELTLDVRAAGTAPPVTMADHLVVNAGQQGVVAPLANDLSPNDERLVLAQVNEVEDARIVPDFTAGTFRFTSGKPGVYYVEYLASLAGMTPVPGLVRVDVVEPEDAVEPPVAVRDVAMLPEGGDTLVNVLANDFDPAGGVLVVQSVDVPDDSGLSVSVMGHETLRVADGGMAAEGGQVTVRYTMSNGIADPVEGEAVIMAMAAPGKLRPPIANEDAAVVRAGDIVTIPVLDNDHHPNDDEFHVDPELVEAPDPSEGEAFVSQDTLRFRAGTEPGTVHATYAAVDSTGQRAAAQVEIQVTAPDAENNNAPYPRDIEARTLTGRSVTIPIPLDGLDPDGDSVEVIGLASAPEKGRIVEFGADSVEYEALRHASGVDSFTYRVRDALGAEAVATVRVGIAPPSAENQAPYAVRDSLAMRPDRIVAAPVLTNDSDPDGDRIGLVPGADGLVLADDAEIDAEIVGNRVTVTAPDHELETSFQYAIEDERGARSHGVVQVTVDENVPLAVPVARDDRVLAEDIDPETQTVDVPILDNDEDPDGTVESLDVELVGDDDARLLPDGSARISTHEQRRLVEYTITDEDGQLSRAFIHVPGQEDRRPTLISNDPVVVKSGETIELPLAEHVEVASQKELRLTSAEKVRAAHASGSLIVDEHTLTYTSCDRCFGPDAITFEVTDGAGADDPNGRVATLSIPITVTPPDNEAPEMVGASMRVGAGDAEPGTVDLAGLASDIDEDPLTFSIGDVPGALRAEIIDRTTLAVTADADRKGETFTIPVTVDDGEDNPNQPDPVTADIEVTVTASTRPMPAASDDTVGDWDQGESLTVDVLDNDVNPFADEGEPLTVVSVNPVIGSADELSFTDDSVTVTPGADYSGRLVLRYVVQDATGDPDRVSEARVRVNVQGVPDAPSKPRVTNVQSRQVTLTWRPPADNGATIEQYRVEAASASDGSTFSQTCGETTCTLTGLTNNVTYTFVVTAINAVGDSEPSPVSTEARPDVRPDQPDPPRVPSFGDGELTATWEEPHTDGSPISRYDLEISPTPPNGVARVELPAGTTEHTWGGLVNGTSYSFRVRAHNDAPDPSDWSATSPGKVPARAPDAPGAPTASRQGDIGRTPGDILVEWSAVTGTAAGGDAVDVYEVQAYEGGSPHGEPKRVSATSAAFALPPSESAYTFQVRAKNKAGWGGWSEASAPLRQFTSPTRPGTPTAEPGDRSISATWKASAADGADEIRYEYRINGGAWTGVGTATSMSQGGLSNGSEYRVEVRAFAIADGQRSEPSAVSEPSNAAVPYGTPPAPSVTATARGTDITYTWDPPTSDNGRPLDAMNIRIDGGAWEEVALSGSRTVAYDYEQRGMIEARVHTAGGWSGIASDSATTADKPKPPPPPEPSASVSKGGSAANSSGCASGDCQYLRLNYGDFPSGKYTVTCQTDRGGGWHDFGGSWSGRLKGTGRTDMNCFFGYDGDRVRLVVKGPYSTTTAAYTWR